MYAIGFITIVLGVIFFDGFDQVNWLVVLFFAALALFLQDSKVNVDESSAISLAVTIILPMIYLCGATAAMLVSAIEGLGDGLRHQKSWQRTMFNSSQFALSTVLAAITFDYLGSWLGPTPLGVGTALMVATVVYIVCNQSLVSFIRSVRKGTAWTVEMATRMGTNIYSNITSGFIGIIFTFFVMSYGYWGLILFSALVVVLSHLLKAASEVSVERGQRELLEGELVLDEMTRAFNFRYLNNWLCEPSDEAISLLFLDVDDFANYNETYGHEEGNEALRMLVGTIKKSVRTDDSVIRYGGDEFVVLLQGMDVRGARRVAGRIRENLALSKRAQGARPITVSLGIAVKPTHTTDKRLLLLYADQAMYQAKEAGKDDIQLWRETAYSKTANTGYAPTSE
jgi:diguanylate cyclase (GGDEF)-like protein